MSIIDDQGRLFGKVNVIDGAVLSLLGLFVITAGAFLLDPGETRNVHAQVEAQDVAKEASQQLTPGTELRGGDVVVTDVQRVPTSALTDRVYMKLNVTAGLDEDAGVPRIGQAQIVPGSSLPLSVAGHTISAQISLVDDDEDLTHLQTPRQVLFVSRNVERPVEDLPTDDLVSLGPRNVLAVDGSAVVPRSTQRADVFVWGSTYRLGGDAQSPTAPLLPGASVRLSTPDHRLSGHLKHATEDRRPIEPVQRRVTVLAEEDHESPRPRAQVGDVLELSETIDARVTDVVRLSGAVVNADGTGPRLLVDLALNATRVGDQVEFAGRPLAPGETFGFQAQGSVFEGTIQQLEAAPPGDGTVEATLQATGVPPWAADRIDPGDQERSEAGRTLLTLGDVRSRPSTVIVTTQDGDVVERDHPRLLDLELDVELHTEGQDRWKDQPVGTGETLYVRPDGVPMNATVLRVT